jgi:PAS domain S-box-containing protein
MTMNPSKSVIVTRSSSRREPDSVKSGASRNRLAERKSVRSEYEQVLDNTTDAIRIINKDFTVRRINRAFAEIVGVNQSDVVGKKCWEVFPGALCHTTDCRLNRVIHGEQTIYEEIERKKKDGTTIACVVTVSPLMDETERLAGIIEQFRDITEHRRMEEQVEESEGRYRSLIELDTEAGEAIVMLQNIDGRDGIQTFFNEQWPRITGYSKEELSSMSFFDLLKTEDRQASIERHRQKIAGISVPGLYEMIVIRKDKTEVPVEITGAPTKYKGEPANVAYIRDLTERKNMIKTLMAERDRYVSLFENVPIGIYESDYSEAKKIVDSLKSRGISDFNSFFNDHPEVFLACRNTLKINNVNQTLINSMCAENKDDYLQRIREVLDLGSVMSGTKSVLSGFAQGQTTVVEENYVKNFLGENRYRRIHQFIAPGYENSWSKIFVWVIDITDLKQTNEALNDHKEQLEKLVEKRTAELTKTNARLNTQIRQRIDFTRSLVHELKTPLTAMLSSSESLISILDNDIELKLAQNMWKSASKLNKRIDELLDIAKGEIGILKIECRSLDADALLNEIVEEMTSEVEKKGQTLTLKVQNPLPLVWADVERLREIILNLVSNALKFNRSGGVLSLTAEPGGEYVLFGVHDEGIGISEEDQQRIFEPYQRLDSDRQHLSGLGLGLALSKTLVELHKGKIWLVSRSGQGSSFYFSIPRVSPNT